jgi:hypothetical protein
MEEEQEKCKGDHKVNGVIPMLYDLHFDKAICDCKKVKWEVHSCGCSNQVKELKKFPNE